MDNLVNAVAVPVPIPSDYLSDHKYPELNEIKSAYKLPKGSNNVEIQTDALKHLKDQGFTDGTSWLGHFLFSSN